MGDIVLCTLNAKYLHASLGLRCLLANLKELRPQAELIEFDLRERPVDVVEAILRRRPKLVALGVYLWNVAPLTEVVEILKQLRPELTVVLGGPEVSHELEGQRIVELANHIVRGEGEVAFHGLCEAILGGRTHPPKVLSPSPPRLESLALPYEEYTDEDLAHRVLYVEASRGCPFRCEFCLSALDHEVRPFPREAFLSKLEALWARGARRFKFVDRTFNFDLDSARALLEFFLSRLSPELFLHFEMVPDRFPEPLKTLLARFPDGTVQLEIGLQTLNAEVSSRLGRPLNVERAEANLRFLRHETNVHLHADLIAGLPGEGLESLGRGFDRLHSWAPHEIQLGVLKRLKGTPLGRHDDEFAMRYASRPPYEVLETKELDFGQLQRVKRLARTWDLFANSGRFASSYELVWRQRDSVFHAALAFSDWLVSQAHVLSGISLARQFRLLAEYLAQRTDLERSEVRERLLLDYQRDGRNDLPSWVDAVPRA